jgi:Abi-like protein
MVAVVIQTLSQRRFDTYLQAAGHDQDRAIALYLWNAKLGASFHLPIQAVEIALRNRVNHALVAEFGPDWWNEQRFVALIDRERTRDLDTVRNRIAHKRLILETDQIVAGLSFGFWVGMLHKKHNPAIWSKHLRISFPALPASGDRHSIFKIAGDVANFRNRISHHEPLIKADSMLVYSEIMRLLSWLCPDTAILIRSHCEIPKVVRQKP